MNKTQAIENNNTIMQKSLKGLDQTNTQTKVSKFDDKYKSNKGQIVEVKDSCGLGKRGKLTCEAEISDNMAIYLNRLHKYPQSELKNYEELVNGSHTNVKETPRCRKNALNNTGASKK